MRDETWPSSSARAADSLTRVEDLGRKIQGLGFKMSDLPWQSCPIIHRGNFSLQCVWCLLYRAAGLLLVCTGHLSQFCRQIILLEQSLVQVRGHLKLGGALRCKSAIQKSGFENRGVLIVGVFRLSDAMGAISVHGRVIQGLGSFGYCHYDCEVSLCGPLLDGL